MRLKVTADVHGDLAGVCREADSCDLLLVLGDLINMVDYHRCSGILAEVYGPDAVRTWAKLRTQGKFAEARAALVAQVHGRETELRELFREKVDDAHREFCTRLPANVVVTFGNVDTPDLVRRYTNSGARFVDSGVIDAGGLRIGIVGGGLPKAGIPGEVSIDDYAAKVASIGPVDVLCAHVPPAIEDLTYDVVADFNEPGSEALLAYVHEHAPSHVYFGHVHQPRAERMRVGECLLVNVGCEFRRTGRAVEHPA